MTTEKFDPKKNYEKTREEIGYVTRKRASQADYDRIGFMSGLEVHQQLLTKEKLFCHCPAGIFNKSDDYDAEIIRHMRPTLSELGEYDGTALMEFRTRKEIVYRIKNTTACTYEIDDTPPFQVNKEALAIAIEISLLSKLNIVGEVHITRKQYLDGSIPTGFQRTAIIGVEGEISLKNKKVRLIQLSMEEDACREISDIGHVRIYKTDRLGMPLIETVTYPDMVNPGEVMEANDYIRFLNRSTGKVRTGMGAAREDVNVSCRGGTRVEIKGVAHTKWIPELTHNECFRQWALLHIREILGKKEIKPEGWKISSKEIDSGEFKFKYAPLKQAKENNLKVFAVNLPGFHALLSHFTQPGRMFADEISERLKVIACIEKPHMTHSEDPEYHVDALKWERIRTLLKSKEDDAQIIFWGPADDIKTALETIEERCKLAFTCVPSETRKSFENGTTIFERVLPGPDRMYPDTDSAPIPLKEEDINNLRKNILSDVIDRYHQLKKWGVPEDTYKFIFKKNLYPLIEKIVTELQYEPVFAGTVLGHFYKFVEGHYVKGNEFNYNLIFALFNYLKINNLDKVLVKKMIPVVYEHPKMDFDSVLTTIKFKKAAKEIIIQQVPFLKNKFSQVKISDKPGNENKWVMGQLRQVAVGNICLKELSSKI